VIATFSSIFGVSCSISFLLNDQTGFLSQCAVHHFLSLKSILPMEIIRTVYLSLNQAVFQYSFIIWGGLTENNLKPLKLQQNKIIRICQHDFTAFLSRFNTTHLRTMNNLSTKFSKVEKQEIADLSWLLKLSNLLFVLFIKFHTM